jgi:hypothetical protein
MRRTGTRDFIDGSKLERWRHCRVIADCALRWYFIRLRGEVMKLHISLYQMPDGMYLATCAEIPMCRVLRHTKEHAYQDARKLARQFLLERQAEGREFTPELREFEVNL